MIRRDFAPPQAGLMTDPLCHDGQSYLAYTLAREDRPRESVGVVVLRWPTVAGPAAATEAYRTPPGLVTTHGFPRLAVVEGAVRVLFRRDQPTEAVVCADVETGVILPWAIPCEGLSPCAWGRDGLQGVNTPQPYRIVESFWPNPPARLKGTGRPTGLSHHDGTRWVTWDEVQDEHLPTWDPDFQMRVEVPGGAVGVTPGDQLRVRISTTVGTIPGATGVKRPRIAPQPDGAYLISYHTEGSQGPTSVVVLAGVTAADLVVDATPTPTPDPVPLPAPGDVAWSYPALNRPRAYHFAFFTHGAFGSQGELVGNTALCIGGSGTTLEKELDLAVALGHAIICPPDPLVMQQTHGGQPKWFGFVKAFLVHADDWADAERQVTTAQDRMRTGELGERPIFVYIDKPAGDPEGWRPEPAAWVDDRVWPLVQWNVDRGETREAARARLGPHARMVAAAHGRPIGLAIGTNDRGWGAVGVAGAIIAIDLAAELGADDHLEVIGYAYFSDYRDRGMQDHPEIRARALALTRATHDPPARLGGWVPNGATLLEQVTGLFGQNVPVVEVSPPLKAEIIAAVKQATQPGPGPGPTPDPTPLPGVIDVTPYLVDRVDVVEAVKADYPHLQGGAIVDQVAHRLNRLHGLTADRLVFGRKARQSDGGRPNEDALAIRRRYDDPAHKALVDVLINAWPGDPAEPDKAIDEPTWSVIPAHEEWNGDDPNGYWRPPVHPDLDMED